MLANKESKLRKGETGIFFEKKKKIEVSGEFAWRMDTFFLKKRKEQKPLYEPNKNVELKMAWLGVCLFHYNVTTTKPKRARADFICRW